VVTFDVARMLCWEQIASEIVTVLRIVHVISSLPCRMLQVDFVIYAETQANLEAQLNLQ
jgi:hypothetical protein